MDNVCPKITENIHTVRTKLPLLLCSAFTCPYYMIFHTHLEDKVDLWAAGSGKYGGVVGRVNCIARVRDTMGTSSDCEGGWKEQHWERVVRCPISNGKKLSSGKYSGVIQLAFQGLSTPIVSENQNNHKDAPLLGYSRAMSLTQDLQVTLVGEARLIFDPGLTPDSICIIFPAQGSRGCPLKAVAIPCLMLKVYSTIGLSKEKLQIKVVYGKRGGISKFQLTLSSETQWKLHSGEGKNSKRHKEYRANSVKVKLQPQFNSLNLADYWFSVLFIPPLSEVVPDYYPP